MTRFATCAVPLMFLLLVGSLACQPRVEDHSKMDDATAEMRSQLDDEMAEWKLERLNNLTKPDGWLSLVGLEWLEDGAQTLGSGEDNQIVLPLVVPADLGTVHLTDGEVALELAPDRLGVPAVTVAGEDFSGGVLASDSSGDPTVVEVSSVSFYVIERSGRFGLRIKDSQALTLTHFQGLGYYPAALTWRVVAKVLPYEPVKMIKVPNVLGTPVDSESPAALEFYLDGEIHRLDALEGTDGGFFLVFGDKTNGVTTYGGGRFLYTDAPDESGKVVVDFNRAYSPPCVFTPYATCPLPPPQNKLAVAVEAGEKNYEDGHH